MNPVAGSERNGLPRAAGVRRNGFSLIELLIALAIAVILLVIGIPSFASFLRELKLITAANDFHSSILLARAEAIRQGRRIDLAPLDEGGDWSKGWAVFVDGNGNLKVDGDERVVFSHGALPKGVRIKAALTDSKVQYLSYDESGRTRTKASANQPQYGTFTVQADDKIRKIILNFLGRPRICNPDIDKSTC